MKKILALLVFALTLLVPSAVAQTYEPVVYPAQQDAVGTANLSESNGTYTFSNSLFTAQFVTTDGHLMFGGCDEMNLKAGTELFVITFGDGTVVNASQMTLGEVTTGNLAVNSSAAKGAEHFPGKYLQAVHTYTKGSAHVTFTWRAELRDGSHYLRTDLTMTSDQDVQMSSIVPMQYAVDALAAGSTPAVVGNTRGAVLMSNKIFAGLETPTAYNSVVSETTVPEKWSNYGAWTADYFSWTPAELPTGITNLSSKYNTSNVVGARGYLKFETAGSQTITFTYSKGSHKLNIVGVDVLDTNGNVVAHDYHQGYTGGNQKDKVYTLDIPSAGYYQVRYFVTTLNWSEGYGDESITSEGNIAYSGTVSIPTVVFDLDPVAPASTRRKVLSADHIGNNENITDTWDTSTNQFQDMNDADVPARIVELGHTANNIYYREQDFNISVAGGTLTTTFTYKGGNNRLQIVGVDLVDGQGNIAVNDYHFGFTGNEAEDNTYKFIVPAAGQYKLRYLVSKQDEDLTSNGDIAINYEVIDYLHLPAPAEVTIQGLWSRQTTLKASTGSNLTDKDVVWNVSSVVGIVNPDHKRRSFLAYSERERAVAWRPFPHYNSWFELNINRNNAAPGSEATNSWVAECTPVVEAWKTNLYDKYGVGVKSFVWDDGWDQYGEWQHHSGYPNGFKEPGEVANSMNAGIGAWLGPVGGYGTSGGYRRDYWNKEGRGGMSLSNKAYYDVFKAACERLVKTDAENYGHEFNFFKFDGISSQFSAVGPDAGATGNESAEGIIGCERYVRENLKEDIFFNTSVGTWASPFWFHFTDAVWRQENDYGTAGNGANDREKWITYRDRLVYQNFVQRSPICPINTIMTHGFILHQRPDGNYDGVSHDQSYKSALNELRCAFASGDAMVELYADHRLLTSINDGALWKDIADCIKWQEANKDVLPDIHWVGGNPWTGSKSEIYGWASWNGTKATLTLRNGAPTQQTFTTKLRDALDVPASCTSSVYLVGSFDDLKGTLKQIADIDDNTPISLDTEITFTLPASSVYVFDGSINKFTDASFDLPETEPVTAGDLSALTITFTGEAAANVKLSTDKHTAYLTKKAASAQVKAQNGKFNAPRLKAAEAPAGAIEGEISKVEGETGKFSIAFPEESIEAGDYEVSIPAGTFYVGTEDNPVAELKANYTVEEAAIPTDNISDVINYGHLQGASNVDPQWKAWEGEPRDAIKSFYSSKCATGNLWYIEKTYTFAEGQGLQSTFTYSASGNSEKTEIVGVELLNYSTEDVVYSEYHEGSTGGSHNLNAYTITGIKAGTYKVRYIVTTANSEDNTGGTITNVVFNSPQDGKYYIIKNAVNPKIAICENSNNFGFAPLTNPVEGKFVVKFSGKNTETSNHWNNINQKYNTWKISNVETDNYVGWGVWNQDVSKVAEANAYSYKFAPLSDGSVQFSAHITSPNVDDCTLSPNGGNQTELGDNASGALRSWNIYTTANTNRWVIEEIEGTLYTIALTGDAPNDAVVTINEKTYSNGSKVFSTTTLSDGDVTVSATGYSVTKSIANGKITVNYTKGSAEEIITAPFNYTPLNTECWSEWGEREVPQAIKDIDATNFTATNLRVIEKEYDDFPAGKYLQTTFQYTSGTKRTEIVGVEILKDGAVVFSDYHFGWTGSNGNKLDNVYVLGPVAETGTYTVRYISSVQSAGNEKNVDTNGTITNALLNTGTYTVHIINSDKVTSGTAQVTYKGVNYSESGQFNAPSGTVKAEDIDSAHDYLGVNVEIAETATDAYTINATYTTLYHPTWRTDGFEDEEGVTHPLKADGTKYMIYDSATERTENWTGFMYPRESGSPKLWKTDPCTPLEFKGPEKFLWTIEKAGETTDDGFYLKNVATGKYYDCHGAEHEESDKANALLYIQQFPTATMSKADSTAHSNNFYEELIVDIKNDKGCWVIGGSKVGNNGNDCWNGQKAAFNNWPTSSPFCFYEVVTLEENLTNTPAIKDVLIDYCQYFEGTNDKSHDYLTYQEKVHDAENLELTSSFTDYVSVLREEKEMAVKYPQPVTVEVIDPSEGSQTYGPYGRFITVRNSINQDYLKGNTLTLDRAVMWLNADNELVSYDTGLGYSGIDAATAIADGKSFEKQTLSEVSPQRGTLVVKNAAGKYMASSLNNETKATSLVAIDEATTTNATTWYVDNADYVVANIPASGYTTFYAPVPFAVPDGVEAYIITADEDQDETGLNICTLTLTNIGFIPAQTAVVLQGEQGAVKLDVLYGTYGSESEKRVRSDEDSYWVFPEFNEFVAANNVLKGYDYTCTNPQTSASDGVGGKYIYTLSNGKFQYYTGSTIKAFKCFLELTQDYRAGHNRAAVNPFRIIFNDGTESISGTKKTSSDGNAFDLSGRRINVQSERGLYILNGKKVIR